MIQLRHVQMQDAEQMLGIYAPYILDNVVSFEIKLPSIEEFQERIKIYTSKYPWLVAEENGRIIGYAYASTYREREAYKYCVETSVYVANDAQRKGVAKKLYDQLFEELKKLELHQAFAVITLPNDKSVAFHAACGFISFATFPEVGFKFNQWHDVHWMRKVIG